jgi:hypothetical protein
MTQDDIGMSNGTGNGNGGSNIKDATTSGVGNANGIAIGVGSGSGPGDGAATVTATTEQPQDGFEKVLTKEERRKRKKVEKHRPQFHFDMSAFKNGRKIGIAVSG